MISTMFPASSQQSQLKTSTPLLDPETLSFFNLEYPIETAETDKYHNVLCVFKSSQLGFSFPSLHLILFFLHYCYELNS